MRKFKEVFRKTLCMIHNQYLSAQLYEDSNKGYWLENSPSLLEKKNIVFLNNILKFL